MVKSIKRIKRKEATGSNQDLNLEGIFVALRDKGRYVFSDTSYLVYLEVEGREAIKAFGPDGSRAVIFGEFIAEVGWGHAHKPEPVIEPQPEPQPEHKAAVVSRLGEFPVYHYSRLQLVQGAIADSPARESVETRELVESMREAQCFVPAGSDVIALHRSGSFLCWELADNLFVIDDEGSKSACHIFSDRQLALNVLRGYTGRRAAKRRDGHIKSFNHTRGWLSKVEDVILGLL